MVTTKENCYQGLDRTVLIELKKIYDEMQQRSGRENFGEVEQNAYRRLQEIFTNTLYRPFLQGDNRFDLINTFDKDFFIDTISAVIKYIKLISGSLDIDMKNLKFRLERIVDGTLVKKKMDLSAENEFANGKAIDVSKMPEADYLRAAKEFSEGSEALEKFLLYCYRNKIYTKACCTGHECKDSSKSLSYLAFDLSGNENIKKYLMSRAFENNMEIVIINFDNGLGFDLILNPYELDQNINFLQKCLKEYKGDEQINPVIHQALKYCKKRENDTNKFLSMRLGKTDDDRVIFEERNIANEWKADLCTDEEYIEAYKTEGKVTSIDRPTVLKSRDVAKCALEYTKKIPGRFSESMKRVLRSVTKFVIKDNNREEI